MDASMNYTLDWLLHNIYILSIHSCSSLVQMSITLIDLIQFNKIAISEPINVIYMPINIRAYKYVIYMPINYASYYSKVRNYALGNF